MVTILENKKMIMSVRAKVSDLTRLAANKEYVGLLEDLDETLYQLLHKRLAASNSEMQDRVNDLLIELVEALRITPFAEGKVGEIANNLSNFDSNTTTAGEKNELSEYSL